MPRGYRTDRRTRKVYPLRGGLASMPSVGRLGHERYSCERCGAGIVQGTETMIDGKIMCPRCAKQPEYGWCPACEREGHMVPAGRCNLCESHHIKLHVPEGYEGFIPARSTVPNIAKLLKRREYKPVGAREPRDFFAHTRTARELAEMRKRERE